MSESLLGCQMKVQMTVIALPTIAALMLLAAWGTMAIQAGGAVEADVPGLKLRIEGGRKE